MDIISKRSQVRPRIRTRLARIEFPHSATCPTTTVAIPSNLIEYLMDVHTIDVFISQAVYKGKTALAEITSFNTNIEIVSEEKKKPEPTEDAEAEPETEVADDPADPADGGDDPAAGGVSGEDAPAEGGEAAPPDEAPAEAGEGQGEESPA